MSLVEVLMAMVLIAIGVTAVLGALRASILGSARDRELMVASAWLQTAAEKLELHNSVLCDTSAEAPRVAYETEARRNGAADNGGKWPATSISVRSVKFWTGTSFGDACSAHAQLVTMEVSAPDGRLIRTADFVKTPPVVAHVTPPAVTAPARSCTVVSNSFTAVDRNGNSQYIPRQHRTLDSHMQYKPVTLSMTITGSCNHIRVSYTTNSKTYTVQMKASGSTYTGKVSPSADEKWALGPVMLSVQQANAAGAGWTTIATNDTAIIITGPA